ncbi:GNAT family N-acetyltransferase [Arthrobacter sp. 135MFCol5.1]|uniref:GNAT family N-acetyltransferase n=1 Tax=Arthrobacter sp. 135MFCol5.1 TaxID=1158050 RepID=UPI00035D4F7B
MPVASPDDVKPSALELESAMDAAWPARERQEAGNWVLRAADGVTQRANSIWPRVLEDGHPDGDLAALLAEARAWYRLRRLPVIFQLFDHPATAALQDLLDAEGFTRQSETVVMTRSAAAGGTPEGGHNGAAVELAPMPSEDWLRVWWEVDGRGGKDALGTARAILEGCPSLYALARDSDGRPAAVGRLAMPAGSTLGGVYGMATRTGARRKGFAAAILHALLHAGVDHGMTDFWLLVTAQNHGARELYSRAGFSEYGRYLYRQERPRRPLTGC